MNVTSPLSMQTTNNADLTINADCYTKSEVNSSLALKQNVINNVPGTGERLFEVNLLKRIFAIAPLQVKTYLNLNDPDDPKNANIELSIDSTAITPQTTDALNLKADKSDVWTKAQSNILSANVRALAASLYDNY